MKIAVFSSMLIAFLAINNVGATTEKESDAKHRAETVAQHKAMAKAHEEAAKCLESGKPEESCHEQLLKACKGLGIGKRCGMKHSH